MIDTTTLLPMVCLDENEAINVSHPLPLVPERAYLLLGQVSLERDGINEGISHFVLHDLGSGKTIPGMFHGDRFRFVTPDDNFF